MLVTHQLQYLYDVKNVVIMENGQIKAQNFNEYLEVFMKSSETETDNNTNDDSEGDEVRT